MIKAISALLFTTVFLLSSFAAEICSSDFSSEEEFSKKWRTYGMLMVPQTKFSLIRNPEARGGMVLRFEADSASGVCATRLFDVDPAKYPIVRWRWRVISGINHNSSLPEPDDQPAVLYIGDGASMQRCAVAYRWEKETPLNSSKRLAYQSGLLNVRALTLRNKNTPLSEWVVEEREYAKDFAEFFNRKLNKNFVLSIGANSQNSKSHTIAEIDYIEFLPAGTTDRKK